MSLNGEIGHVSQYRHNCLFCDETHRYLNDLTKGGSNSSCLEKHNTHAMLASASRLFACLASFLYERKIDNLSLANSRASRVAHFKEQ